MAKKTILRLLLVEDNLGDARLLREMLNEESSTHTELTHVDRLSAAETYVAEYSVDLILLDLGLPDSFGLTAIQRVRAVAPAVPLVVLTGLDDESIAGRALQEGAQDYLIKGQIETRGLMRAIRYAIERCRMECALDLERARLEAANKVLGLRTEDMEAFTYSVSHDLKEPLRAIEGFSQYLITNHADELNPRGQDLLNRIAKATIRMKYLIEDLLALSRAGRESDTGDETSDTRAVVREVVKSLEVLIKERHATVKIGPMPCVAADSARIDQIFRNLISNGLKYNRNARPTIQLGVAENDGKTITFYIKDNGIGIDRQYHDQIFRLFQRLHTRDEFEGNGAGLAIVKRAAETLAGNVWLESEQGMGTTFFVSLPSAEQSVLSAVEKVAA